jgi:protein-tyrosine phosphatase
MPFSPLRYPIRLLIKTMFNVRDLGGFPTVNGEVTAFGRFLRSDAPICLDQDDLQQLLDYPVRTVIDLRSPTEIDEMPHALRDLPDIDYFNIPLLGSDLMAGIAEAQSALTSQSVLSVADLYIHMLQNAREPLGRVFSCLAAARPGACLFHCSHGKDRTGVVTALLLLLAGVEDIDIVVNYQVSSTYLQPWFATFIENIPADILHFFSTQPQNMELTLRFFHEHYASAAEYLISCGVSCAEIADLRRRLLA